MNKDKDKDKDKGIKGIKCIKLLKDFDTNDLTFKPIRKTTTGSRIIDVNENTLFQTCWLNILYDVDYTICVRSEKIKDILNQIDEKVISHSSNVLGFSKEEILQMYRPLLKQNNQFSIPILTNTVLFDNQKKFYNKSEIKNILKKGQHVRFIFNFKKIYFKDHELTFPLELQQIEVS